MVNRELKNLILLFRKGDESAFFDIFDVFAKMINIYVHKINRDSEDVKQDLIELLLRVINTMDLDRFDDESDTIQRYLCVCLRTKYINISKSRSKCDTPIEDLTVLCSDPLFKIDLYDAIDKLSPKQKNAILHKYIMGYSVIEISNMTHTSRQSVNTLINRGLKTLNDIYGS